MEGWASLVYSYTLYTSRFVSQAGQGLFFGVLVLSGGGSASPALGLSSILVAMVAGALLFAAPAGMLIDRIGATRALLLGGGLRFVAVLSGLAAIGDPALAVLAAFLYSSASQVFSPAELTLVRWLRPDGAQGAHATLIALQYGGQVLGVAVLTPLLFIAGGAPLVLSGSLIAYVIVVALGVALMVGLPELTAPAARRRTLTWRHAARYFHREPRAAYAAGLLTFADVATKCLVVALPFYLREQLDLSALQLGTILVLGGAGAIAGLTWSARTLTVRLAEQAMRITMIASIVSVVALAGLGWTLSHLAVQSDVTFIAETTRSLNPGFLVTLPAALVLGFCFSVSRVGARTVLSETAPRWAQGKIFAAQGAISDAVVIAPLLAVGMVSGFAGARVGLLLVASIGLVVLALLEWVIIRGDATTGGRDTAERPPELAPELAPEVVARQRSL